MQASSQTAEGEQGDCRSNTASGTDPILDSTGSDTFPDRGEVATLEGSDCLNRGWSHLVSQVHQRPVCTGELADCRSDTASGTGRSDIASGTGLILGSRHPGIFPTRGEVATWEGSDRQSR